MKKIRIFIAIELPTPIQKKIENIQLDLKGLGGGVSWVKVHNIHLTLKFLGDVVEEGINAVADAVTRACGDIPGFTMSVQNTGFFPNAKRPRVLWVGCLENSGHLVKLHRAVEENLAALGFEKDNRKFSPHLTIGRVKNSRELGKIVHQVETFQFEGGEFAVKEVIVMQSELHPSGSIYTPLKKINLQKI